MSTEALVDRVEELSARLDAIEDAKARACAGELVGTLMQLYGEGLERIFAAVDDGTRARLADDGVVASLMLLHGLYPVDLETRVREALETIRPYMESHGGGVELVSLVDGVAHLRLAGSCEGCPASASTLEHAVKQALEENAPDLLGLEVEGVEPAPVASANGWRPLTGLDAMPAGALAAADGELVIANVDGTLLAYRNACASCGARLDAGVLILGTLTCTACGHGFNLPGAGRSSDGAGLQLEPVPLLREDGGVRVAA